MEIDNEDAARAMIKEWGQLPPAAQQREIRHAIQRLELSCMYYEQKGNTRGVARCERSILILGDRLAALAQ
ncbi:MAG: hypothetical protein RBR09_00430 [Desulfobulbaceae bacterium]|jgi:hypothetical protein|nr:hypothetical protein [Desulfobulbaceae bacterium]MDY0349696.1 hypothetical protein [Desulfobulbaceae bacterium]